MTVSQEDSPRGGNFVRTNFIVRDTGIGMSEEFQKKIFDSFAREDSARVQRTEGTGLGMAITKYIVDEMKGTITVSSQRDKGSCFHVTLDLEAAPDDMEGLRLPPWDMLLVDDDEQLCRTAARERCRQGRDYHVILLDWKLPGMDGIETARRLRCAGGSGRTAPHPAGRVRPRKKGELRNERDRTPGAGRCAGC